MAEDAHKNGQIAMSEELIEKAIYLIDEAELFARGYKCFLTIDFIDKWKEKTKRDLFITKLENFARVIPDDCMKKISKAKDYFHDRR